jgi:predicted NBD/HSP70 family sugar kinase
VKSGAPLWGIDLGGTKIEGALVDPADPLSALHRLRRPTGAENGYEHILSAIEAVVDDLARVSGLPRPVCLGIGTPGTEDPASGCLKNSNTVCLNGRPLCGDLSQRLGCEVRIANDANCFALAEATWGAAAGADVVLGLIIGSGTGAGIVAGGRLIQGLHGIAGEWGHNPIRNESAPCYCGRTGCVETVIAGPSLERFYREATGEALRLPGIVSRATEGDRIASATLERLREKFSEAIAAVMNILDPDVIVVGGGVGNLPLFYEEATRASIARHLFNPVVRTRIVPPALGDSAGVFGAARLSASFTA